MAGVGSLHEQVLALDVGHVRPHPVRVQVEVVRAGVVAPADVDAHLDVGYGSGVGVKAKG